MNNVVFYAYLEDVTVNKTPKYKMTLQAGKYPAMEALRGKDNEISFFLLNSKESGSAKDNAPAIRLQGKGSFNFTDLHEYFINHGKISNFAYGYPYDKATYGKDKKPNPFFGCKNDCYLFIKHQTENDPRPKAIELLIIENAKDMAGMYCQSLQVGGFDDVLKQFRQAATNPKNHPI